MTVFITPKKVPPSHSMYGIVILNKQDVPIYWSFSNNIQELASRDLRDIKASGSPWEGLLSSSKPIDRSKFIIFTKDSHPEYFI